MKALANLALAALVVFFFLTGCKPALQAPKEAAPAGESSLEAPEALKEVVPEDDGIWTVNLDFAKKTAAEKDLSLLICFTGEGHPICESLSQEVFSDENFQQEVVKKFVPVKINFSRTARYPEEINEQYSKLVAQYEVSGLPTLVLTDSEGRAFAMADYQPGGAEIFMAGLNGKLEAWNSLKDLLKELGDKVKANDVEAKKAMQKALADYLSQYKGLRCIKESFKKCYDALAEGDDEVAREIKRNEAVDQRLEEVAKQYSGEDSGEPMKPEMVEKAVADYQAIIDEFSLEGEKKQEVLLKQAIIYYQNQESDKAEALIDAATAAAPDSDVAREIKQAKENREFDEMTEGITKELVAGNKEAAIKLVDDMFPKVGDNKEKAASLYAMKGEISVLFNDAETAKECFTKAAENSEGPEKDMFESRLRELTPFDMAVAQSQLLSMRGDHEGMAAAIETAIANLNPDAASLQKAYVMESQAYMEAGNNDKTLECLQKAIDAQPESELADVVRNALEQVKAALAQQAAMGAAQGLQFGTQPEEDTENPEPSETK